MNYTFVFPIRMQPKDWCNFVKPILEKLYRSGVSVSEDSSNYAISFWHPDPFVFATTWRKLLIIGFVLERLYIPEQGDFGAFGEVFTTGNAPHVCRSRERTKGFIGQHTTSNLC